MKKTIILVLYLLIGIQLGCNQHRQQSSNAWLTVTDDISRQIVFEKPPMRIISLAPSLTEMCFAIDSGATLVGVTQYCNFPPATKKKPSVGGMVSPNFEKIAELQPDLIIVTVEGNSKEDFAKLESMGFRLFVANPRTLEDIYKSILTLGRILQRDSSAVRLVEFLRSREESIRSLVHDEKKPKVFAIISIKPLMTAGPSTFIHQLIVGAGGINIAEKAVVAYPIFNREEVLHQNPDFLVVTTGAVYSLRTLFNEFPEWTNLEAVKKRQVLLINSDILTRPGPRIVEGLEILARVFHPEKFKEPQLHNDKPSLQLGTR